MVVALVLAAVVIVGLIGVVTLLVLRGGDDSASSGQEARPTEAAETSPPTSEPTESSPSPEETSATTKPKKVKGPGDVRDLPAGLFCRDLEARGFSYVAAVDYWRAHGQPNQMDSDRNGIPCETVFSASDVEAYWGPQGYVPDSYDGVETLPAGLFCRDLAAAGYSYPQAVDYWWSWGAPDRMDANLDGVPCETVYSAAEVNAFWY